MTTRKSDDYWEGYRAEAARHGRTDSVASLARDVSRALGRDQVRKEKIIARSPGAFAGMDSAELATASARELAARELKELGIDCGDADPVQLLDVHHQGRQWARDRARGRASDSAEPSFLDKYLNGGE